MMGPSHAASGAVVAVAVEPLLSASMGWTTGQSILFVVATTGGAMLPDLDQHGSNIGRTYGWVTNIVARLVAAISGGHRNGTHSILGVVAIFLVTGIASALGAWIAAFVLWLMLGVACRAWGLHLPSHHLLTSIVHGIACGVAVLLMLAQGLDVGPVVPFAAALGAAIHIAGDALTPEGVPLLWPVRPERFSLGLFTTGKTVERLIVMPVLCVALVVILWWTTDVGYYVQGVREVIALG